MKKIKEKLIHLLGGYTKEEYSQVENKSYNVGYVEGFDTVVNATLTFMQSLYGVPAEEWCKRVYRFVTLITKRCYRKEL